MTGHNREKGNRGREKEREREGGERNNLTGFVVRFLLRVMLNQLLLPKRACDDDDDDDYYNDKRCTQVYP